MTAEERALAIQAHYERVTGEPQHNNLFGWITQAIRDAVVEERIACAALVEEWLESIIDGGSAAECIAAAIRQRGERGVGEPPVDGLMDGYNTTPLCWVKLAPGGIVVRMSLPPPTPVAIRQRGERGEEG